MFHIKRLRRKTHVLVVLMVLFSSVGEVLLGMGMKQIGAVKLNSPSALVAAFVSTVTNGVVWLGILLLLLFFVCFLLVLSWADYSYVMPASAFGYAVVAFLGHAVLREVVSPTRWAGVACICLGVLLVGQTPPRTTHPS